MPQQSKTDNYNLPAKLALRRHFLRKYHADGAFSVLDCCQGDGVIWSSLRAEFPNSRYWGVDVKPKKGRLKIDSIRILQQPGWTQDVIDVDTYGEPWKHWFAMLPHVIRPTTVFLTLGLVRIGGGSVSREVLRATGLDRLKNLPKALANKLSENFPSYCLARCCDYSIMITEAIESVSDGNARYFGVRLEPK